MAAIRVSMHSRNLPGMPSSKWSAAAAASPVGLVFNNARGWCMTAPTLIALLIAVGFGEQQAAAIEAYSHSQSGSDENGERLLDPCAKSWMGDGLFGLTQELRRAMHAEAGTPGCVPPQAQVAFIAHAWPEYYPHCAVRFAAGDLRAFRRCFGLGEGN
jgi:hypothetical protein